MINIANKKIRMITISFVAVFSFFGLAPSQSPYVVVSSYPLEYFTRYISQETIRVINPVSAVDDPIFWMPTRQHVATMQSADLIFVNGAGFEKWIDLVTLPSDKIITTAASFKNEWIVYENAITHSHGGGEEHSHEGLDGNTWVDPLLALLQAREIKEALEKRYPQHRELFEANYASLQNDLKDLDAELKAWEGGKLPLLMAHPAYNYLGKRYGLNIRNIDLDPVKVLDEKSAKSLSSLLKRHNAKIIVWESEPTKEVIDFYTKKWGLKSVIFSSCVSLSSESRRKGNNYITVMKDNIHRIKSVLK